MGKRKTKNETVALDTLIPHPNNTKIHDDAQIDELVELINEYGFMKPIVIDETSNILAGHGVYYAAKKMGLKEAPVWRHFGLSDRQKRLFIIADNKVAEHSKWDFDMLVSEVNYLVEMEAPTDLLGFNEQEMDALLKNDQSIFPESITEVDRPKLTKERTAATKTSKSKLVHECPECGHKFHS